MASRRQLYLVLATGSGYLACPSFGRLLMSAPLEPGDLPERNRTTDAQHRPVTRYLVDTNVISAYGSYQQSSDGPNWSNGWIPIRPIFFLSVVTIAEIADGNAKAKREGARRKAFGPIGMAEHRPASIWRSRTTL